MVAATGNHMKQVIQSARSGKLSLREVPKPTMRAGAAPRYKSETTPASRHLHAVLESLRPRRRIDVVGGG